MKQGSTSVALKVGLIKKLNSRLSIILEDFDVVLDLLRNDRRFRSEHGLEFWLGRERPVGTLGVTYLEVLALPSLV